MRHDIYHICEGFLAPILGCQTVASPIPDGLSYDELVEFGEKRNRKANCHIIGAMLALASIVAWFAVALWVFVGYFQADPPLWVVALSCTYPLLPTVSKSLGFSREIRL